MLVKYLIPLQEFNEFVDMFVRYSVYDFAIVFDQLHNHVSSIQSNLSLIQRKKNKGK